MKKVFTIHGWMTTATSGWKGWLAEELNKKGIFAENLLMPNPNFPRKEKWVKEISKKIGDANEDIFLVGHSLGVPAILHYLESLKVGGGCIGGVVLVSGVIHKLKPLKYRIVDNFLEKDFDFEKIKKVCKKFVVIHGDDDYAVPFIHAIELSKNLNCLPLSIHKGGHLSGYDGFKELPQALNALEEIMK